MRRLYLTRHAIANKLTNDSDFERELTDEGKNQAVRLAEGLGVHPKPQLIVTSPATRTLETAEIINEDGDLFVEIIEDGRLYNSSLEQYLSVVQEIDDEYETVMIVGHNPNIQLLANFLAGRGEEAELQELSAKFPECTSALISLDVKKWLHLIEKCGRLDALLINSK